MDIQHIITALIAALLGSGVTWFISLRKLRPEIRKMDAEAESTRAQAAEAQARAWNLLVENQRERLEQMNRRMDDLECSLREREKESHMRDKRIEELETELENKEFVIKQQKERLTALETQVNSLQAEVDEWKSGKRTKPKTGPLQS